MIRGGKSSDTIYGGDGNDQISGDLGGDTLHGGGGSDIFLFADNDAAFVSTDTLFGQSGTILDYADGQDKLHLGFQVTDVVTGTASTLQAALGSVSGLLSAGQAGEVAAVSVGSDVYLLYGHDGGSMTDNIIALRNMAAGSIDVGDFV